MAIGLGGAPAAIGGCLDQPDHLEPTDAVLASFDGSFEHQAAVRRTLLAGQSDKPYLRVIGLPAFFPEWSLTIDEPEAGAATIKVVLAKKPVYTGKGYRSPSVETFRSAIDAETAVTLREVLEHMLLDTRPCHTLDGYTGFDGETYVFSGVLHNRGVRSGEAWSPEPKTRTGQLVGSVTLLLQLTLARPPDQPPIRERLVDTIAALHREVLGEPKPSSDEP